MARAAGGFVTGYWQVVVQQETNGKQENKTKEQIEQETLKLGPEIQQAFSAQ